MKTYTISEVVKVIDVSQSTIRDWTRVQELQSYLSDLAAKRGHYETARTRKYTENDLYVFNTVQKHKSRGMGWEELIDYIETEGLDTNLPPSASLLMPTSAEAFGTNIAIRQELDIAIQRIDELKEELNRQRENERIRELDYVKQITRLEMQIELLKEQLKNQDDD